MANVADVATMLQASEPDLAARLRDPRTTAEEIPLPFLKPDQRYVEVITRTGRYPTKFPVLVDGHHAVYLADRPDELKRVARTSGFKLDTRAAVVAYVATLLRLGQPYSRRLMVLERFTELQIVTSAKPDERVRYDLLAAKYAGQIGPPAVEFKDGVAKGSGFVVRAQTLERLSFSVHRDGLADISIAELEPDLPIDMQA